MDSPTSFLWVKVKIGRASIWKTCAYLNWLSIATMSCQKNALKQHQARLSWCLGGKHVQSDPMGNEQEGDNKNPALFSRFALSLHGGLYLVEWNY